MQIKSNTEEIEAAVARFKTTDKSGVLSTIQVSNIAGMHEAVRLFNPLISNLSQLEQRALGKAEQLRALAYIIEARDKGDAEAFGRGIKASVGVK
jgi:hypothetical protein